MTRLTPIDPNVAAFLDMISFSEGTCRYGHDDGYDVLVGGKLFTDYSDHPRILVTLSPTLKSTAAGRYQILARYFDPYKAMLLLPDFSPVSQDRVAVQLVKEQGALQLVIKGDIRPAILNCSNIWASFPGAGYHQHEEEMATLLDKFKEYRSNYAN